MGPEANERNLGKARKKKEPDAMVPILDGKRVKKPTSSFMCFLMHNRDVSFMITGFYARDIFSCHPATIGIQKNVN